MINDATHHVVNSACMADATQDVRLEIHRGPRGGIILRMEGWEDKRWLKDTASPDRLLRRLEYRLERSDVLRLIEYVVDMTDTKASMDGRARA